MKVRLLIWRVLLVRRAKISRLSTDGEIRDQSVPCLLYADELDKQMKNPTVSAVQDRWLSVQELSGYLGIKRDTVYKWILRRNMPAHKAGRLWKFRKDEIDEWVRSGAASERDN